MAYRPIFYDTETTGVKYTEDRIIEIAAYDPSLNKTFCEFINPKIPIPPEATMIHQITDEMIKNAPCFEGCKKNDHLEYRVHNCGANEDG